MVEEYAGAWRGPSVLAIHDDRQGKGYPFVWGIPKDADGPAVLITVPPCCGTMVGRSQETQPMMRSRQSIELIHAGRYAAEIEIELH